MVEVGFGEDENNTLAGFDDFASETLVKLGMWLSAVNEEAADVGFFDGSETAEGRKLFDAHLALAWLAEAGGVEQFDGFAFVFEFGAVNVASGAAEVCYDGLLFLGERVKK